jgi:hypothetical protein
LVFKDHGYGITYRTKIIITDTSNRFDIN